MELRREEARESEARGSEGAYGSSYIACALGWPWAALRHAPDRWSLLGAAMGLIGSAIRVLGECRGARGTGCTLELGVQPPAKDLDGPAVSVVGGIRDVLVVERQPQRFDDVP